MYQIEKDLIDKPIIPKPTTVYYCKNEKCVIKLLNNCKEITGLSFNGAQNFIENYLEICLKHFNMFKDFNCLSIDGENEVQTIHADTLQYCKDKGYNIIEITK